MPISLLNPPLHPKQTHKPPGNNGYVWLARSLSASSSSSTAAAAAEAEQQEEELHTGKAEVLLAQKQRHAATVTGRLQCGMVCWCVLWLKILLALRMQ